MAEAARDLTQQEVPLETYKAIVKKVKWRNPDTGWGIAEVYPATGGKHYTIKGFLGELREKERIVITGRVVIDEKFGHQFEVTQLQLPDFKSGAGILAFLQSGYIKGVGESLAKEIFDAFGEQTANILEHNPERLLDVKGIGKAKLNSIIESWNQQSGKREALAFFAKYKIGPATVTKILDRWKNVREALRIVRENPYILAWEISGVAFAKADEIAMSMGFERECAPRIEAAVGYALHTASATNGHCFLPRTTCLQHAMNFLDPIPGQGFKLKPLSAFAEELVQMVDQAIASLVQTRRVFVEGERVYLHRIYQAECKLAELLRTLSQGADRVSVDKVNEIITRYEQRAKITLHENQREAVIAAACRKVCVITGGPGTGKTTIIKCLLEVLGRIGLRSVSLAAPTGKAAKRMSEATGKAATTIHRMLGFRPGAGYEHDEENPLEADVFILDEASMLDTFLARATLAALKKTAKLILVGDVDQLPSVSAGKVLSDIIQSRKIPVVRLTCVFRQSENSFINLNAQAIRRGSFQEINRSNKTDDFFWMDVPTKMKDECGQTTDIPTAERLKQIRKKLIQAVIRLLERGYGGDDIQVLSPAKAGPAGTIALNTVLQGILNAHGEAFKVSGQEFRIGDRVMQQRNDYKKEVFNGDQGKIKSFNKDENTVTIEFDGVEVEYKAAEMGDVKLSYAITVHKSQGSESPVIIQIITYAQYIMLQRNIIYTGVTRAREFCVLIGEEPALIHALKQIDGQKRHTMLAARI